MDTTETAQRIAAATARPEVSALVFFISRESPVRTLEAPVQAMSSKGNDVTSSSQRF